MPLFQKNCQNIHACVKAEVCFLLFLTPDQTCELSSWVSKVVSLALNLYC